MIALARRVLILGLAVVSPTIAFSSVCQSDCQITVAKLKEYCRACHGLGKFRFIKSEDPNEVWRTLQTETIPGTKTLWKDEIIAALSWPDDTPPSQGTQRSPGREWMPKGAKRLAIANDTVGGENVRHIIVRTLRGDGL